MKLSYNFLKSFVKLSNTKKYFTKITITIYKITEGKQPFLTTKT